MRHRGKIEASLRSAKAWCEIEAREGFDNFIWDYVGGTPIQNSYSSLSEVPGQTPLSKQMSKDLKKAGFGFCGPTTVYAFMQAAGLVNDHMLGCPQYQSVQA